jgi:hypothetical protein
MPPTAPQGLAYFPGVNQVFSAEMSVGHGISPSVCTLEIAPQSSPLAEGGTLQFAYGSVSLAWPDCRIDKGSVRRNASGEVWQFSVFDRRWKWSFGTISGVYNLRDSEGTIKTSTEKTPQQLATLCLQAMGETGYSVADLPNDTRPEVRWEDEVPAEALAKLCEVLSCRVVLKVATNAVRICQLGVGASLPSGGVLQIDATADPPEIPDKLGVVCGPTRYQLDLELEAVGLDTDGKVKPVDDLSYKPAAGWLNSDIHGFGGVTATRNARELAKQTVFRWYRVTCSLTSPILMPDPEANITDPELIELESDQVETAVEDGEKKPKPAIVYGVWRGGADDLKNHTTTFDPSNTTDGEYNRSFSFDAKRKLVKFSEAIYRNADDTLPSSTPSKVVIALPFLRLRCAARVKDPTTRAFLRYSRERSTGASYGTKTRFDRHKEMSLGVIATYNASFAVTGSTSNETDLEAEADYYLDAMAAEYQVTTPETRQYIGLLAGDLDGAIQQVTWSVGPSGATTTVSRNNEQADIRIDYKERRRIERTKDAARTNAELKQLLQQLIERMA